VEDVLEKRENPVLLRAAGKFRGKEMGDRQLRQKNCGKESHTKRSSHTDTDGKLK